MTIPDDLDVGPAIRRAVATLPVDVDAGWHDLERRARRSPARVVVWVAAAAVVLLAVLVPIRLLAAEEASLDVGGLPDAVQSGPGGPDLPSPDGVVTESSMSEAPSGRPRPIARLLALPACPDPGDLGAWAVGRLAVRGSTATAERFRTTSTDGVLELVPMPTDLDPSCIVSLRAGDTAAFELRAEDGTRLARGASVGLSDTLVPWDLLARSPYMQGAIASGQSASGALERIDGEDRFEGALNEEGAETGRLVVIDRLAIGTDPSALQNGLQFFSHLTFDRFSEDATFPDAEILPEWLPAGFQRCVRAGLVPGVSRNVADAVIFCDDAGREIRVISASHSPTPTVSPFEGLTVEAFELAPSEPGRRTILVHASAAAPTVVDLPGDLGEDETLRVLQSLPTMDPRLVHPAIGVDDYRDRDLMPFLLESVKGLGLTISPAPSGAPDRLVFDLDAPDGRSVRLFVEPLTDDEDMGAMVQRFGGWEGGLEVRTVDGVDLFLSSLEVGEDTYQLAQVIFGCGQLSWNLMEDVDRATPPVTDELAATLVRGLAC